MALARPIRLIIGVCIALILLLIYQNSSSPSLPLSPIRKHKFDNGLKREPLKEFTGEPEGPLWRAEKDAYSPNNPNSARIKATLISLVRNEELEDLIPTMRELERTWNKKFNYPWTFFNDKPFSEEFKKRTQAETKAKCNYELVPKEHWDVPSWIDMDKYRTKSKAMEDNGIQYSTMLSYHQMCRWNSGMFYKHPALADMQYYWRVEPKVRFFCDVDYDVFRYMQDKNKTYGFTINIYDNPQTIPSLWPETVKFLEKHPDYLHENNAMDWLTDSKQRPDHTKKANGYSTCHFWSNFEIGDLSFWRSKEYEDYFNHLDKAGGFFYERWGDAPVHSIGLGLFADKSKIHWLVYPLGV
ncbi:alpha-1,2 mannosyltransferase KTR1 [Arthroderma uncinatum]|uniref:alpha-1,2 mannosyltransferase KTR1 n=1 Tax=Arthroderma uncinatum TaxID=74035 RepID=UPI00144A5414|nr:alpha-1,2 mannosyltransferase KTR1 [Arthroderma uncinatum]KAF3480120.1 alpha-1,2 mannosyltransferase KTR1 [Arthroderma uncinatum]